MRRQSIRLREKAAVAGMLALGMTLTGTAAASAEVTGATTATARDGKTLGPFGLGGVKLGMTLKQAKATKKIVFKRNRNVSWWELKAYPSAEVCISKKWGVASIFAPKGVKTPQGIGIGSTEKQLRKAYPKLDTTGTYPSATVPGNPKAQYGFLLDKGKINQLVLDLKTQDCHN